LTISGIECLAEPLLPLIVSPNVPLLALRLAVMSASTLR
jgi:hypothetical protein